MERILQCNNAASLLMTPPAARASQDDRFARTPTTPATAEPLTAFKPSPERERAHWWGPYRAACGNTVFFSRQRKNVAKPEESEPRYVFEECVRIVNAGDTKTAPVFVLDEMRLDRYRDAIEKWKADQDIGHHVHDGVPIDEWPLVEISMADRLKAHNVFTVEALADVSDANLGNLGPGARELRRKAIEHVTKRRVEQPLDDIKRDQADLRSQLQELTVAVQVSPRSSPSRRRSRERSSNRPNGPDQSNAPSRPRPTTRRKPPDMAGNPRHKLPADAGRSVRDELATSMASQRGHAAAYVGQARTLIAPP
jgi:hypothetical protein